MPVLVRRNRGTSARAHHAVERADIKPSIPELALNHANQPLIRLGASPVCRLSRDIPGDIGRRGRCELGRCRFIRFKRRFCGGTFLHDVRVRGYPGIAARQGIAQGRDRAQARRIGGGINRGGLRNRGSGGFRDLDRPGRGCLGGLVLGWLGPCLVYAHRRYVHFQRNRGRYLFQSGTYRSRPIPDHRVADR